MKTAIILSLFILVSCGSQKSKSDNKTEGTEELQMQALDGRPTMLVVGDSISIGYTPYVQSLLPGLQVIHNTGNGRNSTYGAANIDAWIAHAPSWEVCTFNHGLWDVKSSTAVGLEDYKANIRYIGEQLKTACNKVVFINTTRVPKNSYKRVEGSELAYNVAAEEVMNDLNIPVCDLHSVSVANKNLAVSSNNVHYTEKGYKVLGSAVVECVNQL